MFGTGDWDALLVWAASSFQLVSQSSLDRTAIQLRNRWKRITQKKRIQLQQQQQQHEIVALPSHPLPPNNDLPNAMDISSTITDISAAAHPISDPLVRRESPVPVAGGGGCTLPHSAASTPDHHRQQNNGIIRITSSSTASLVVPPVNNSPDFIQLQIHPLTSDNNNISAGTSNIPATPHRKTKRIDDYFIRVGDNVTSSASAMAVTTAQQNSSTTSGPTSGSSSTTQSPLLDNTLLTTTVDSRQSLNNEQLQHQQSQHHDPHLVYPQKRARVVSSSSSDNNNTHTTPFRPPSLLFPAPSSFSSSSDQQQQDTLLSFQQTQQYLRRIEQLEVENRQWMAKASDCEETATRERAAYEKRISELEARIAHKDDRVN